MLESVHYELLISAYLANADVTTPFNILCIMHAARMPLSRSTTRPLAKALVSNDEQLTLEAFEHLKALREGDPWRKIPGEAMDVVIEATANVPMDPSALPDGRNRERLTETMERYKQYNSICSTGPTINTFNSLLAACVAAGAGQKSTAMSLASEMLERDIHPTATTYDHLISVCLAESENNLGEQSMKEDGDFGDAKRYYREMLRKKRWLPRQATLERLVMRCVKSGGDKPLILEIVQIMGKNGMDISRIGRWLKEESERYMNWGSQGLQLA